jgi:hypothetical protein
VHAQFETGVDVDHRRVAVGVLAWFLGIIVPVYHHVALHAAIAHQPSNNDINRMRSVWEYLPWVDWAYLCLMFLVGAILIGPELLGPTRRSRKRERPTARGFEVVTKADGGDAP